MPEEKNNRRLGVGLRLAGRLRLSALIGGIFVSLIGVLVLIGWQYDITRLQTLVLGLVPMNPLAAIIFILCGLSVGAAYFFSSVLARRISFFLAGLIIVLSALKLLDIFGINIPVDRILFAAKLGKFTPPSRMPPITAINFILFGLAIFILDFKGFGHRLAQYLALITGSFALFMLLAFLFNSSFSSSFIFFSPLALHGVVNFIILSLAILFLRPNVGLTNILMSQSGGGLLARQLAALTLIVPVILAYIGDRMVIAGFFDFQLGIALILALNILLFEFFVLNYALVIDGLENEREKNQQAVSQAKALDDALLNSIGVGVVATDRQGVVILFNHSAEKMSGIRAEKAIGKSVFKLWSIFAADGKALLKKDRPLQAALISGKTISSSVSEPYYYAVGDKKIPLAITVAPVMINGLISGAIDVFRDISADVEIDQAKSEFVSFASHQLRSPSTAIGWRIEMFLEKYGAKLSSDERAMIDEVYQANRQISDLITDFLNVSKIEYGINPVQSMPVNVGPLITEIIKEQFKVKLDEKKIQAEEKFDRGMCAINADPNLFKLIVDNLLSNAIKYTPENGKITVELVRAKAGETFGNRKLAKDACLLIVADTGYGIPRDQQDKIFTRFYRAENVTDKKIPGTGLGLYMVKIFIQKMGGDIWFESAENQGSHFFVQL